MTLTIRTARMSYKDYMWVKRLWIINSDRTWEFLIGETIFWATVTLHCMDHFS